ncbi:MAG: PP2C family protein-serine/threonine phosphatase, partial [Pseudomonadota bacterium]
QPEMLATLRAQADRFTHFADTFEALAVEISEKRIRAQDMAIAAEIQQALLPRDLSRVSARSAGRADLAAAMIPAKQVGGDYYDAFYVDDHQLALVVGDVAGKGVPAALYMGVACTILRTIARGMATEGPAQTLAQLNRQMARDQHEDMFLTVVYALLDLRDGVVRAACAGHDGAYVLSHGVAPAPLAPTGPAIGLIPGAAYREIRLRLLPGDALLLATDGAWEAFDRSGAVFGETRFEAKLAALSNGLDARGAPPAEALVSGVIDSVAAFADGAPSSDDLTCAAAIWRGPASARA